MTEDIEGFEPLTPDDAIKEPEQPVISAEDQQSSEIQEIIRAEVSSAKEEQQGLAASRENRWSRYRAEKLGNEIDGRSKFLSRDVMDAIESMMPFFMRTYATGDPKIELTIEGVNNDISDALMKHIQSDLEVANPNLYTLLYVATKDLLISDTSYIGVTWDIDIETSNIDVSGLTADQYAKLITQPEIEIINPGQPVSTPSGIVYNDVKAKLNKVLKDEIAPFNIPTWSMLYDPESTDMDDGLPKGFTTKVTLDYLKRIDRAMGGNYFKHLDNITKTTTKETTSEETTYYSNEVTTRFNDSPTNENQQKPSQEINLIEWYTKADVDGTGFLTDIRCWLANNTLIRWEKNKSGANPFVSLKAMIDPYKMPGVAVADLLIDIQNLNTMLTRRILDSFDYANSGRWVVDPLASIDRSALRFNVPGAIITGKTDGIKDLSPAPFNPQSLMILDYVKRIKEERSGVSSLTQGLSSPGLSNSAKETVASLQSAAMQRLETYARTILETGISKFYKKCVLQYQQHLRKPFVSKLNGEDVEITPEMIQGKVITRVIMGASATVGAQESNSIERIAEFTKMLNEQMPGLLQPKDLHSMATEYIRSLGHRNPDKFIAGLKEYESAVAQNQKMQQQMQQMQSQQAQQHEQTVNQLAGKELEIQAQKNSVDAITKQEANRIKKEAEDRKFILDFIKTHQAKADADVRNGLAVMDRIDNVNQTGQEATPWINQ